MNIISAIQDLHDHDLLLYLQEEIENKGYHKEVMSMYKEIKYYVDPDLFRGVLSPDELGRHIQETTLQLALRTHKSKEVVRKLIDIGRKELVMKKDDKGRTALHTACDFSASIEIISKLIDVGGKELVMEVNYYGETALHAACTYSASIETIFKLIEIGGKELVIQEDNDGRTALHITCLKNGSIETISKLIEIGGKELVIQEDNDGRTGLLYYLKFGTQSLVMSRLIEVGGQESILKKDKYGENILHFACYKKASIETISRLIQVGGQKILTDTINNGWSVIHYGYFAPYGGNRPFLNHDNRYHGFDLVLKASILANVGGEFGIGGIFNLASEEVQDLIYNDWNDIIPSLQSIMRGLLEHQQAPSILHAAIFAKAPTHVIQDVIHHFDFSILKQDSLNRYPIEVAVGLELGWEDGMKEIIEATSAVQQRSVIYTAVHYGLKWSNHMKELVDDSNNKNEILTGRDSLTGLPLFMVAAVGNNGSNDLNSIYVILRMNPRTSSYNIC